MHRITHIKGTAALRWTTHTAVGPGTQRHRVCTPDPLNAASLPLTARHDQAGATPDLVADPCPDTGQRRAARLKPCYSVSPTRDFSSPHPQPTDLARRHDDTTVVWLLNQVDARESPAAPIARRPNRRSARMHVRISRKAGETRAPPLASPRCRRASRHCIVAPDQPTPAHRPTNRLGNGAGTTQGTAVDGINLR